MAHATATASSLVVPTLGTTGLFAGLRQRFDNYALYRRTLAELNTLSARDLADLDIDAQDLPGTAWRAVYGA